MLIHTSRAWLHLTILDIFVLINLLEFRIVASIPVRNAYPAHFLVSLHQGLESLIFHGLPLLETVLRIVHLI